MKKLIWSFIKSHKKESLIAFVGIMAFSAIVGLIVFTYEVATLEKRPQQASEQTTLVVIPSPTPTLRPQFKDQEVTEETVLGAYKNHKDVLRVEVNDDFGTDEPDDKVIHVYFQPKDTWSEKEMVNDAAKKVIANKSLFENQQVSQVGTWVETVILDEYGKPKTITAVRIIIPRDTYQKIDWLGMLGKVELEGYQALQAVANQFYINPAIVAKL